MSAETSAIIASIAGKYLHFGQTDLVAICDDQDAQAVLVTDLRALAGSALRQHEEAPEGSILVPLHIDYDKIANAFIGVIEGGYSSWLHSFHPAPDDMSVSLKRAIKLADGIWYATASYWADGGAAVLKYDRPNEAEGEGNGEITLSKAEIALGLGHVAVKAPKHFADLMGENDDAITHDVFVQCCIFGDIIYG